MLTTGAACTRRADFVGYACGLPPTVPVVASDPWNCGPRCFLDENLAGLQGGAPSLFERPVEVAPARPPGIVYPLPGSVHPLNLGGLTLQWRQGDRPYFRLRVTAAADAARRYTFYIPCQNPPGAVLPTDECKYALTRAQWTTIAAENPGGEMVLTIDGSDPGGTTIASSPPLPISFALSAVHGGFYYWSSERQGVFRAVLGGEDAQPVFSPATATRFPCAGCHSVGNDGRVLAFSGQRNGYTQDGTLGAVDLLAPDPLLLPLAPGTGGDGATTAVSRDGRLVAVSLGVAGDAGRLVVRETAGGAEVARLDPASLPGGEGRFYFPAWSPDGAEVAGTLSSTAAPNPWSVTSGSIVVLPFDGSRFGAAEVVVAQAEGLFHYAPAFSPDGAWLAFVSAPLPGPSYGNPASRLRLVARAGGRVHELSSATQGIGKTSTLPRFAPVMQSACNVLFLTFTSKMDFGFMTKNSQAIAAGGRGTPQLWMSAVDLRDLAGADPSRPPVWLPFQQPAQSNIMGSWSEHVACRTQADCGPPSSATCDTAAGACVPAPP